MDADLEFGFHAALTTAAVAGSAAFLLEAAAAYGVSLIGVVSLSSIPARAALEIRVLFGMTLGGARGQLGDYTCGPGCGQRLLARLNQFVFQ